LISKQIDKFNAINRRITENHKVAYYNITDISRKGLEDPSLVASDGLHPSGKMYSLWVKRILEDFIR
jgi:lysophospholipase L1-like esterase